MNWSYSLKTNKKIIKYGELEKAGKVQWILPMCLLKHNATNIYEQVEVSLHSFLLSAL
jgi:hypothetical protein